MPFYRYKCKNCGFEFRVLQLDGGGEPVKCPNCGGTEVERLLPRIGVIYKGNGYYTTEYRKKKAPAVSSASSGSTKDAGTGNNNSNDK